MSKDNVKMVLLSAVNNANMSCIKIVEMMKNSKKRGRRNKKKNSGMLRRLLNGNLLSLPF